MSLETPNRFRFLNESHTVAVGAWDDPVRSKLWRYNLHYFDDLNADSAAARRAWHRTLLERWVRENPPARGTGWESYPTSLRLVNWIKWAHAGNTLPDECVQSLAVQARWLSQHLERHILGNHLLVNAKALVFAGLFFQGTETEAWLDVGMDILARQTPEQFLADGGQFERSTMYHALALEDMLDLCNVCSVYRSAIPARRTAIVAGWREMTDRMGLWLRTMLHPDGGISFFNDAAHGIAPTWAELQRYAEGLGLPSGRLPRTPLEHLAESGYIRLERAPAVAIIDVATIGPSYLPAHAHADTLSFELSVWGQRVLVNSGTSLYEAGVERSRQRGTAAHNTVVINGADSSEVWGSFRTARRARPVDLVVAAAANGAVTVSCAHDGYARLAGKPLHRRRWTLLPGSLTIDDAIEGRFGRAEARFHLHPDISVAPESSESRGSDAVVLTMPEGQRVTFAVAGGAIRREPSSWHPEFGLTEPTQCLVVDFVENTICTRVVWEREG